MKKIVYSLIALVCATQASFAIDLTCKGQDHKKKSWTFTVFIDLENKKMETNFDGSEYNFIMYNLDSVSDRMIEFSALRSEGYHEKYNLSDRGVINRVNGSFIHYYDYFNPVNNERGSASMHAVCSVTPKKF